jgi:hypothetical protein
MGGRSAAAGGLSVVVVLVMRDFQTRFLELFSAEADLLPGLRTFRDSGRASAYLLR